jgi:membrane-associated phospholipid phosphatase
MPEMDKKIIDEIVPNKTIKNTSFLKKLIERIDKHDKHHSNKIHTLEMNPFFERLIYFFARIFNPDFILCYFIIIFLYTAFYKDDIFFVLKPLLHTAASLIVTIYLKKQTNRPRPILIEKIRRLYNLRKHEHNCSLPSGDSLQAANFAIILYFYFGSILGFFLIPLVMFARIFYFCHYIYDTLAGTILGISISYILYICINL